MRKKNGRTLRKKDREKKKSMNIQYETLNATEIKALYGIRIYWIGEKVKLVMIRISKAKYAIDAIMFPIEGSMSFLR